VLAAAAWLAVMRDRIRFGMAIAAMIRMMATTISNSMSEKPFSLRKIETSKENLERALSNAKFIGGRYLLAGQEL
jgi:hypothetical protein